MTRRLRNVTLAAAAAAGGIWIAAPVLAHGDMMKGMMGGKGMMEHCMAMMGGGTDMQQHSASPLGRGKIESLDPAGGTVTLAHEAMPAMNMPAMTMPFKVQDREMLEPFGSGDAVRFELSTIDGEPVVTRLTRASDAGR